jgi:hypothetical protein
VNSVAAVSPETEISQKEQHNHHHTDDVEDVVHGSLLSLALVGALGSSACRDQSIRHARRAPPVIY